jgi:hypothetical protein
MRQQVLLGHRAVDFLGDTTPQRMMGVFHRRAVGKYQSKKFPTMCLGCGKPAESVLLHSVAGSRGWSCERFA